MRHILVISSLCILSVALVSGSAFAVPVYLKPESRFATGNQARAKLESKTTRVQIQRWFRVQTKDKVYGWIAEDHALTALKLVEEARLNADVPARTSANLESEVARSVLKKSTSALVLELSGSWARIQPLPASESPQAWVPSEQLTPTVSLTSAQRAFVYEPSTLRLEATSASRELTHVDAGVYVRVLRFKGEWIEVQTGRSQGYIPRANVWTAGDLGEDGVRAAVALAPLRSEPLPYADLMRSLSFSSTLNRRAISTLRWGLSNTREQGEVWWPMNDSSSQEVASLETQERTSTLSEKITTAQLFARKIYDMARSRVVPGLRFCAAQGIFRTIDGETWTKIPLFRNENYPIAVAKSGAIFIGPYVSEDHGETFQQWIKWDSLVSSLTKTKYDVSAQNLKIVEVHPDDASGKRVTLRLNVGLDEPIKVGTDDQGSSWRTF